MANNLFLDVLRCAMTGEHFESNTDIPEEVWSAVFELGRMHKVLPLIFDASHDYLAKCNINTDYIRSISRQMIISQANSDTAFLNIAQKLFENKIPFIVVKGIACRRLYRNPGLRISSDEDILVKEPFLASCDKLLTESGFVNTTASDQNRYQHSYRRSDGMHIEVHRTLFSQENRFFCEWNSLFENAETETFLYENSESPITTFSPDYSLLFLILHSFKHFINAGVGIRQICDIAIYSNAYKHHIHWDFIHRKLSEFKAIAFTKAIFAIGDTHLGFKSHNFLPESFITDIPPIAPLLEDILEGGIYGTASLSRAHSRSFTENAAQGKNTSVFSKVFPKPQALKARYRYAKNPLLLPLAYSHRIFRYAKEVTQNKNNSPVSIAKIGARRIELLKLYSVIKSE